mgnify:FL=1
MHSFVDKCDSISCDHPLRPPLCVLNNDRNDDRYMIMAAEPAAPPVT